MTLVDPDIDAAETPADVYLFATCLVDLLEPAVGLDVIAVLERCGVRVHFPQDQTCCGQPAYTTGYPEHSRPVAAAQLDLFPEPWPIVVPSGSCAGMIHHHWPRLFAREPALLAKAEAIAARVVEFTDFVTNVLTLPVHAPTGGDTTVCLHTSCSARREMGTLAHGRALLDQLPGVALAVHDHESECCGFGGTFCVKHPEISASMAADKLDAIAATGCDQFVSADCGCLLNLNQSLARSERTLRGQHIASFLRQRLDGEPA